MQLVRQTSSLVPSARDDNLFSEQWQLLKPVELLTQANYFTYEDCRGRLQPSRFNARAQIRERSNNRRLFGAGSPSHRHRGSRSRPPAFDQPLRDLTRVAQPHVDHQRFGKPGFAPIDCGGIVSCHECHRRRVIAVRERHARIGRDS